MEEAELRLPISIGEALDKYSILQIKREQIADPIRLVDIYAEMDAVFPFIEQMLKRFAYHYQCLYNINKEIWDLSALVRDPSISEETKNTLFLETFHKNDARFRVKSKLNKLTKSNLKEQKSYSFSYVRIKSSHTNSLRENIEKYRSRNGYIRYLALCYDTVILEVENNVDAIVRRMFYDDPHIAISSMSTEPGIELMETIEPISNFYGKYDFNYVPALNYIAGGKLGDFIHLLYVVMCVYETTGAKGNIYITGDKKWGGDDFSYPLQQTFDELFPIVVCQPYVEIFELDNGTMPHINLNDFRRSHRLYYDSWLENLSNIFGYPLIEKPWISLPDDWKDEKYTDMIIIHRSMYRHVSGFTDILESIIRNNRCLFLTSSQGEYNIFPFNYLVPVEIKSTLKEIYVAINSCKFFIGNQSSPLAIAYSMFKPSLCESFEGGFYVKNKHYSGFNWYSHHSVNTDTLLTYTNKVNKVREIIKVAIINHAVQSCGVYQYGKRLADILVRSQDGKVLFSYHEITNLQDYVDLCSRDKIDAILYNYHPATIPWLTNNTIQRAVPNIAIYHEGGCAVSFEYMLQIDATTDDNSIPRPLLESSYATDPYIPNIDDPIIGSFGFGFNNKGFVRLIESVNAQFDRATIRLNITFAHFGDQNGDLGREIAKSCESVPRKEGIKLIITHNFMDEPELLKFLSENTINIFLYDHMGGRGCSSVIDYALSVNRPIGISDSEMFRHIYSDAICVYKTPIKEIIVNGLAPLNIIKRLWGNDKLLAKMEDFILNIPLRDIPNAIKMKNNTVLTDEYRDILNPTVAELFKLVPDMMSRKISRANVQQAFAFKYIRDNFTLDHELICAGSHEDTCCAALKVLGYKIVEIDPKYNSDLHTYCLSNEYPQYDVVFSVSVIEHVANDDEFIDDICKLMKPGGTCVLTCDFNDSYKSGDRVPTSDCRFYTKADLTDRFGKILDHNNCYIEGEIDYSAPPDFVYEGILYSFATLIFKKHP